MKSEKNKYHILCPVGGITYKAEKNDGIFTMKLLNDIGQFFKIFANCFQTCSLRSIAFLSTALSPVFIRIMKVPVIYITTLTDVIAPTSDDKSYIGAIWAI